MEASLQEMTVVEFTGDRSDAGQFHGFGRAVFSSGQLYEGQWQNGHMHGAASIIFPDGVKYEGSFKSDAITGKGVYRWSNMVYEGEVLNGLRHGFGILAFIDSPVRYEGQWQHGKRHGLGTLYYDEDRATYYQGDWEEDVKQGTGVSMYPDGSSYTGTWLRDMRHGSGRMSWLSRGQVYSGQFSNNMPNGLGEHIWLHGAPSLLAANHAMHIMYNRYYGMFLDGKRHGEGSLWYSNGARYEGQWQHDQKHGQGVYLFEDGMVFCGEFLADRPMMREGCMLGADSTVAELSGPVYTNSCSCPAPATDAVDAAAEAGISAAVGAASGVTSGGPPGFGPRISKLQLYIADLLSDCTAPMATYKAVSNLLVGYNTELRVLYDKYCNKLSPVLDPDTPRNSWALQCGQLWELLRNGQVLCRHLQLHQVCHATMQALQPPPVVQQRRQQVLATADASAVLVGPAHPFDPATELLFRDFCEVLVRLAPMRYPLLPRLEQQLQQLIAGHLLPLLGSPTIGGSKLAAARQSVSCTGKPPAAAAGAAQAGPEQLQQEELVLYLQSQAQQIQQVFVALLGNDSSTAKASSTVVVGAAAGPVDTAAEQPDSRSQQLQQEGPVIKHQQDSRIEQAAAAGSQLWLNSWVTVRQVVQVFAAGMLQQLQMSVEAVAAALLDGVLSVTDPEALRARVEEASLEPNELDLQQHYCTAYQSDADTAAAAAAGGAAVQLELVHWIDCPLLMVELLWGLVRCATLSPGVQAAVAGQTEQQHLQMPQQEQEQAATAVLPLVSQLLEGKGGLFEYLLGVGATASYVLQQQELDHDEGRSDSGVQHPPTAMLAVHGDPVLPVIHEYADTDVTATD